MKLIIEVTEGYYEYLKERKDNNLASVSDITILDGIPYEETLNQNTHRAIYDEDSNGFIEII